MVERHDPDVVVVDVRMPPTHTTEGLEAARRIRDSATVDRHPGPVAVRRDASRGGPDPGRSVGIGYLLKDRVVHLDDIADAVRRVAAGGSVIDPEVVGRLLGRPRPHSPLDELTRREREILGLMAEGRSNQGIAERARTSNRRPSRATSARSSGSSASSARRRTTAASWRSSSTSGRARPAAAAQSRLRIASAAISR